MKNKILVVEDQEKYQHAAIAALGKEGISLATNYQEAIQGLAESDAVITDIFFPEGSQGNNSELQARVLEKIKMGMIKRNVEDYVADIKERCSLDPSERLVRCLETLAYNNVGLNNEEQAHARMKQTILLYVSNFREEAAEKLESALSDMNVNNFVNRMIENLFNPLKDYMGRAKENQPLGYLVTEEAERLGKPFVLVTSLRHSEGALIPIIRSVKSRGWNILEGNDGSKEDPEYWENAYKKLGEKTKW